MDLTLNETQNSSKVPSLCLNMIVKNESKIITRLFDSVASIIDCYCICDTGSTDNTYNVIQDYFKKKNIPGKIVNEPFKNFCHNRNFALNSCIGMSDYVLLLDADMILEIKNFNKSDLLNADSFHILQGNDSFYYKNMRIVKNNGLYSYTGVTHEYINTPHNNKGESFNKGELFIRDIGDGGSKQDKFARDIKLLLEGIKEDPKNVRYHFYLANSYHDSGKFNEAIEMYKKRIELGGWQEEVWYSYYRIGLCFKNIGKNDDAITYWMEGYDYYPQRLEGLYEIIKHYRVISKHKLADLFYKKAIEILNLNHNRNSYLFLHNDVYTSKLYYEYTIIALYVGHKNINDEVVKVLNNSNDGSETNNLLSNMKFYKDVLKQQSRIDSLRLNLTGLSHGGWMSATFVTGDPLGGPFVYANQVNTVITVQGVQPGDNQPYPQLFANFKGRGYLCFEQRLDFRDGQTVVNYINSVYPGKAQFILTNFSNGGHCCWNQFYGGQGVQPAEFGLDGIKQTIYQWLRSKNTLTVTSIGDTTSSTIRNRAIEF